MNPTKYTFRFAGGNISVYAFNKAEAEILAKAEAIKKGWDYKILRENVQHVHLFIDWARLTEEEEMTLRHLLTKAQPDNIYKED